jgi:glycosyltransferase involved in cell wall biosynthesis
MLARRRPIIGRDGPGRAGRAVRILHVSPFEDPACGHGGTARAARGLCRALAARGHAVTLITATSDGRLARDEERDGVRIARLWTPRSLERRLLPWAPGAIRAASEALGSDGLLHLHGHRSFLAASAARAARRARRPWVLQPHGSFPHHAQARLAKSAFDALWGHSLVAGAAALVAVSPAEARDLPRPATVVPNGLERWPHRQRPRPEGAPRLLFVGNDSEQKRGRVLGGLLRALPDVVLDVVGPAGRRLRGELEGFGFRVSFAGLLDDTALAAAYARAQLVVHPGVGEAFGFVPFEAALCGTAAVVAGGHGCGEWFASAGGCVVPPDAPEALAAAVRERLADPERAAVESDGVAAWARRELSWERAAVAMEEVYAGALGGISLVAPSRSSADASPGASA